MAEPATAGFSLEQSVDTLQRIFDKYKDQYGSTIPILQEMQEEFGYLPEDAVNWMADSLGTPRSKFFGVATFYSQFHLKPRGKNIITVCCGTACHVKGAEKILDSIHRETGLGNGKDTTDDLMFTIEKANCVGACSIAPVVIFNKDVLGKEKPDSVAKKLKNLKKESA